MSTSRESLWTVAPEDRPREKLARLGPGGLSDSELVALVLGSGMPGVNVLDSAGSLLRQTGGVTELMTMTVGELRCLVGVGVATAGRIVAVAELWRRANDPPPGVALESPRHVAEAVRAHLAARPAFAAVPGPAAERAAAVPAFAAVPASAAVPVPSSAAAPALLLVVADGELRLRVVVPLAGAFVPEGPLPGRGAPPVEAPGRSGPGPRAGAHSLVAAALHEVLYRGGSAFALALVVDDHPEHLDELRAVRDVLKLASATVGLRYLSTVVVTSAHWAPLD